MPTDKTTDKDKAPVLRPARKGGPAYPVVRTYYNPHSNQVMDVLEVPFTIPARLGVPPQEVTIHKHVRCLDEEIQAKYTAGPGGGFDIEE